MGRIRIGGVITTIIGGLWAVLSLIFGDHTAQIEGFVTGLAVAAAGGFITAAANWRENR